MYVFFWETPLEGSDDRPVARVARVCKTDPGINDPRLTIKVFRSFVKAQLICNSTLSQSDTSTTKLYPFISERQTDVLCMRETKLSCTGTVFTYLPSPLSPPSFPPPPLLFSPSFVLFSPPSPSSAHPLSLMQLMCSILTVPLTRRLSLTWCTLCSNPQGTTCTRARAVIVLLNIVLI